MEHHIQVENIKCGGCARTVENTLNELAGVSQIQVDVDSGMVTIHCEDQVSRATLAQALSSKGYPEVGELAGLESVGAKAKSFVSCAVGRIDNMTKE